MQKRNFNFSSEENYKTYLNGFESKTEISNKLTSAVSSSFPNIKNIDLKLSEENTKKLVGLTKTGNVSMDSLLCSACGVFLQKFMNTGDVVFRTGTPEKTFPCRVKANEDKSVIDVAIEIENKMQSQSFKNIASKFDLKTHTDITLLNNYNGRVPGSMLSDNAVVITNNIENGRLNFNFKFDDKKIDKDKVKDIIEHFNNLISEIDVKKDIKTKNLDLLSNDENLLLQKFNHTEIENKNKGKTIVEIFEKTAERFLNKTALICEGKGLTYKELNEKSNQLAYILRNKGVGPESLTAIILDRSTEMIISMMAVLKAGGAYMPIDPVYPKERSSYMMDNGNVNLILSKKDIDLKGLKGDVIIVDDESIYKGNSSNLTRVNKDTDLMYVLYTSGSTGNPKGVMIEHNNVVEYINSFSNKVKANADEVVLQETSVSFDGSVEEMYSSLINGSTMVIAKNDEVNDIKKLIDLIEKHKITRVAAFPLLLNEINNLPELPKSLQVLISGGDVLRKEHFSNLLGKENLRVYNTYGPSECTVGTTYLECNNIADKNVPIGPPLGNYKVYILDKNMNPVSPNHEGELYISSDGVGRGYLNNEKITNERFIQDPFNPGKRMFKTGDLGKWLKDGNIEFCGRMDSQLKINGYRTELKEIENKLISYPGVKDAVVLPKEDSNQKKFLIAFLLADKKVEPKDLRKYLTKDLPEFMIPSFIKSMSKMPLTVNGKIDRKELGLISTGNMDKMLKYEMLLNGSRGKEAKEPVM